MASSDKSTENKWLCGYKWKMNFKNITTENTEAYNKYKHKEIENNQARQLVLVSFSCNITVNYTFNLLTKLASWD